MMAHVRPEKYSRLRALFAAYTAKNPAYLRAKFLGHKKPSLGDENAISCQEDGRGNACVDVGRHCYAGDCLLHFLFALNVAITCSAHSFAEMGTFVFSGIQHETG
jgi:hypothetical protein